MTGATPGGVLLALLIALLVLLCAALALGWWRASRRWSRASRSRNRRAQRGEAEARALLEDEGYEVLDTQLSAGWTIEVDGEPVDVRVRADLLVARDGLRYVAEVKTGGQAPDPTYPPTRRQLLEYMLVFEPDGLLLVNPDEGTITEVGFPEVDAR